MGLLMIKKKKKNRSKLMSFIVPNTRTFTLTKQIIYYNIPMQLRIMKKTKKNKANTYEKQIKKLLFLPVHL